MHVSRRFVALVASALMLASGLVMTPGFTSQAYAVGALVPNGAYTCPEGSTLRYDTDPAVVFCEVILVPGATSWVVPAGVESIDMLIGGAGGGGGAASYIAMAPLSTHQTCHPFNQNQQLCQLGGVSGGGGGAGEIKVVSNISVSSGQSLTLDIGLAGAGGSGPAGNQGESEIVTLGSGTKGSAGGATHVTVGATEYVAKGGGGGLAHGDSTPDSPATVWGGGGGAAGSGTNLATAGGTGSGYAGGAGVTGAASETYIWNSGNYWGAPPSVSITTSGLFNAAGGGGGNASAGTNGIEINAANKQYGGGDGGAGLLIKDIPNAGLFSTLDRTYGGGGGGGASAVRDPGWVYDRGEPGAGSYGNGAYNLIGSYPHDGTNGSAQYGQYYDNEPWAVGRLDLLIPGGGGGGGNANYPDGARGSTGAVMFRFAAEQGACDTSKFRDGTGAVDSPFQVHNEAALNEIRNCLDLGVANDADTYFIQYNDIYLSEPFEPITGVGPQDGNGNAVDAPFRGSYNGDGYAIHNITIEHTADKPGGLFSSIAGSQISELTLIQGTGDGFTSTQGDHVGALVGSVIPGLQNGVFSRSIISDVTSDVLVTEATDAGNVYDMGGLVGELISSRIERSHTTGDVIGYSGDLGGLVGTIDNNWIDGVDLSTITAEILSSSATGDVIGSLTNSSTVGGLIGYVDGNSQGYSIIEDSFATGEVQGESEVGGFAGFFRARAIINASSSSGMVTSGNGGQIGGFIGFFCDEYDIDECTITNSSTTSEVHSSGDSVGGFAGEQYGGTLFQVHANNDIFVDGDSHVGGLVGLHGYGNITLSGADTTIQGARDYTGGLVGLFCDYDDVCDLTDSYSTGTIEVNDGSYQIGSLIGYMQSGYVNGNYSTSTISANDFNSLTDVAALIGYYNGGDITRQNLAVDTYGDGYDNYAWTSVKPQELRETVTYSAQSDYSTNESGAHPNNWNGSYWDISDFWAPATYNSSFEMTPNEEGVFGYRWNRCSQFHDGLPFIGAFYETNPCLVAETTRLDEPVMGFDGDVKAIETYGDNGKIVAGDFSRYGWHTGGVSVLSVERDEELTTNTNFPNIFNYAQLTISDGNGGYYFALQTNETAYGVYHLMADGSMDDNFAVEVDGAIYDIELIGAHLYVGGDFDNVYDVDTIAFSNFIRVDARTGVLDQDFERGVTGAVQEIESYAGTIVIGGHFDQVQGSPRMGLAQLVQEVDGYYYPSEWNPGVWQAVVIDGVTSFSSPDINIIKTIGSELYVGGRFDCFGNYDGEYCTGNERVALAAFSPSGMPGGLESNPNGRDFEIDGNMPPIVNDVEKVPNNDTWLQNDLFAIGGYFQSVLGENRASLAIMNLSGWGLQQVVGVYDQYGDRGRVNGLAYSPNYGLYVAGEFATVLDQFGEASQTNLGIIKLEDNPDYMSWWRNESIGTNGPIMTLARGAGDGEGDVMAAGFFDVSGGLQRSGIARIGDNDQVSDWSPDFNGTVNAIDVVGDDLYVGGNQYLVNRLDTGNLAKFDLTTGDLVTDWTTDCLLDGEVRSIVHTADRLYVAGTLEATATCDSELDASYANGLISYDLATGERTTWDAGFAQYSPVHTLHISTDGNMLYAGGNFNEVDGDPRGNIASFDITDTENILLNNWGPIFDGPVDAIASNETQLFVGGGFNNVASETRFNLVGFPLTDGDPSETPMDWNPALNDVVRSLHVKGDYLYVGGDFTEANSLQQTRLAAYDTTDLSSDSASDLLSINIDDHVSVVTSIGSEIFIGGHFNFVDGEFHPRVFATNALDFLPAPIVDSITPDSGPLDGGTEVTIVGSNFRTGLTVTIGGVAATNVQRTSPTEITAVTPAGAAGSVDVVVTNNDTQSGTLEDGFTYVPAPTVTSLDPEVGSVDGGTVVEITGTGFSQGATVFFDADQATDVVVDSDTTLYATTPAHEPGWVDVKVENSDGQEGIKLMAYEYRVFSDPAPEITSIDPTHGPAAGGNTVEITGTGFVDSTVKFGNLEATNVVVVSETEITAVVPAGTAGDEVSVRVTNADDQEDTLIEAYTYDEESGDPLAADATNVTTKNGQAKIKVDGTLRKVTKKVDSLGTSQLIKAGNSSLKFTALGSDNKAIGIPDGKFVRGQKGRKITIVGSGLKANADVKLFMFSTSISLGTATTDSKGNFTKKITVPKTMRTGHHTIQVNTYTDTNKVMSSALGVQIDPASVAKKKSAIITFAANSSKLSTSAKAKLDALIKQLKKKKVVHIVARGYVQPNNTRKNDITLSKARANAVAYYFKKRGIKVKVYSKAEGRSKIKTSEGRRVTIKVSHQAII